MNLQKRLAGRIMKCSPRRVHFDSANLKEIKEAITKYDVRGLINKGLVRVKPVKSTSKFMSRKRKGQKRKGRRKGYGSRKGAASARRSPKRMWISTVRAQRKLLRALRRSNYITKRQYKELYNKSKGGFFRSSRHIKIYLQEQGTLKTHQNKQ